MGHACGHNLIATAAVAGAYAAAEMMAESELSGTISVIGTPAEEGSGGKVLMLRDGAFEGVDYVLLSHPFAYTAIDPGALAVTRYAIRFSGRESHAAAAPYQGVNALDAVNLLFAGVNAWRQQLPPGGMVHGIISDGGVVPNIIPGSAEAKFYIRSESLETQVMMEQRFRDIVAGAALMTGCEYELNRGDTPYEPTRLNHKLSEHIYELADGLGMAPRRNMPEKISTDFGNVSQQIPGVNFFFGICENSAPSLHSVEFCAAAASDYAFERAMKAAAIMAATGINILRGNCQP
jgi:amidohydrolase